jgi:hypothetical protein
MLAKRFERRSKLAMKLLVTNLGLKTRMSWVLKMGDFGIGSVVVLENENPL